MKDKSMNVLRPKELADLLGISIQTLYKWHKKGAIPVKKRQIGPRMVGYLESEVREWLENTPEAHSIHNSNEDTNQ